MTKKDIKQPSIEEQRELNNVLEDSIDYITIGKKKIALKWIKRYTLRKISDVILNCKNEDEVTSKCAALLILNDWWKIKIFYKFLWKKIFRTYSDEDLARITLICKKKVASQAQTHLALTIYLTEMKDTIMTMTRAEAERFRQELISVQDSQTEKNIRS